MPNNIFNKFDIRGKWETMSASHKRMATIFLGVMGLILLMWFITATTQKDERKLDRDNIKKSILTDANTRALGIDALNAKVKQVSRENDQLNLELERMKAWRREIERRRGNDPDMTKQLDTLSRQVERLNETAKGLGWDVDDLKQGRVVKKGEGEDKEEAVTKIKPVSTPTTDENDDSSPANRYFRGNGQGSVAPVQNVQTQQPAVTQKSKPELKISTFSGKPAEEAIKPQKDHFIPSGSLISGVTLNGLDALTSKGAKTDPFPLVVRVQTEAILPNNVTSDINECFITMSGYGDLSSERVLARGEKLSCQTLDGNVIEVPFPSYAVGEDGKAGLRGRLVTRTGSLIAKTAMAGFGAGVAAAFGKTPVPVIQTGAAGEDKVFQNNLSQGTFESGMSGGASAAFERLAKYYMDMADQIYPVIEVDGGRQIDIFVTSGVKLSIKDLTIKGKK